MSVIIKGMKLPQHAAVNGDKDTVYRCAILVHADNSVDLVVDAAFASAYDNGHNIQRYPITEIPTPHGRLIDAEELSKVFDWKQLENSPDEKGQTLYLLGQTTIEAIREAPTIIEAEASE